MKFLNKKEQIIQIELTQYGKHLLSKGVWNPEYYAFFDDNILYDSEFAGFTEHQNNANDRIVKNTPQVEVQYNFDSAEEQVKKVNEYIRSADQQNNTYGLLAELGTDATIPQSAQYHAFNRPLGTSRLDSDYAPSWSVKFLRGDISGSSNVMTGSYQNSTIPQIDPNPVIYKYRVVNGTTDGNQVTEFEQGDDFYSNPEQYPNQEAIDEMTMQLGLGEGEFVDQFDDGNYLAIYDDSLIIEIAEENTDYDKENFDIEVYRVDTDNSSDKIGSNKEILVPLYFSKKPETVKNGLLLDIEEIRSQDQEIVDDDPSYVGYYFNVYVDNEIDTKTLVGVLDKASIESLGIPRKDLLLADEQTNATDLYKPVVDQLEEDCD